MLSTSSSTGQNGAMDAGHAVPASPRWAGRGGVVRLVVLVAVGLLGLALAVVAVRSWAT